MSASPAASLSGLCAALPVLLVPSPLLPTCPAPAASKIHAAVPGACALVVNSGKLSAFYEGGSADVFECFTNSAGQWVSKGAGDVLVPGGVLAALKDAVRAGGHATIADIDDWMDGREGSWLP